MFRAIGEDWMLVTAAEADGAPNPMTASWGMAGILWNKPVAAVFLRPQRYTTGLVDAAKQLSLSFFAGGQREALRFCGSRSGRDTDKWEQTGLTPAVAEGIPYVAEADTVMLCRVLYRSRLEEQNFLDPALLANYREKDYHMVYLCEIQKILKADGTEGL